MPKDHTDHEAAAERAANAHDVHDIRALTMTGAIPLPQQRTTGRNDRTRPRE